MTSKPADNWTEHATEEQAVITQLRENSTHYFKVQSQYTGGDGPHKIESDLCSVKLEWTKPEQGTHNIISYTVFYCSTNNAPNTWREYKAVTKEDVLLPQLPKIQYITSKLDHNGVAGVGLESDISESIRTKIMIPSQSGKSRGSSVSCDNIQLEWSKPEQGAHIITVTAYRIFYCSHNDSPDRWIE